MKSGEYIFKIGKMTANSNFVPNVMLIHMIKNKIFGVPHSNLNLAYLALSMQFIVKQFNSKFIKWLTHTLFEVQVSHKKN